MILQIVQYCHFISSLFDFLLQVSKLVELYKESASEWSKKAGELEGVIKALEVISQPKMGTSFLQITVFFIVLSVGKPYFFISCRLICLKLKMSTKRNSRKKSQ